MFPIRSMPNPPYWPAYPEPERSRLEAAYRKEVEEWRRELRWNFWPGVVLVIATTATVGFAALMLAEILPQAIVILAR